MTTISVEPSVSLFLFHHNKTDNSHRKHDPEYYEKPTPYEVWKARQEEKFVLKKKDVPPSSLRHSSPSLTHPLLPPSDEWHW
jgi:hypothetical protein